MDSLIEKLFQEIEKIFLGSITICSFEKFRKSKCLQFLIKDFHNLKTDKCYLNSVQNLNLIISIRSEELKKYKIEYVNFKFMQDFLQKFGKCINPVDFLLLNIFYIKFLFQIFFVHKKNQQILLMVFVNPESTTNRHP